MLAARGLPYIVAVALFAAAAVPAAADSTNIVVEGTYPPWNSQTSDGELIGFDVDLAKEVCRRAELDCEITAMVWDSQIPSLVEGRFDAMMTVGPTPKRLEVMAFSTPYAATPETFAVTVESGLAPFPHDGEKIKADEPSSAAAIEDLKAALDDKIVGVIGSTSLQDFLEAYFSNGVEIRAYKSSPDALLDLKSGRIDAMFDSSAFLRGAKTKPENADIVLTGPLLSDAMLATDVAFGIQQGNEALKEQLDAAITSMIEDGTVAQISNEWFGFSVAP